jgi:uncharacterized protein YkwD
MLALAACTPRTAPPRQQRIDPPAGIEARLFDAINAERRRNGVSELQWHDGAARAAEAHSRSMAERRFFSHTDPERGDLRERLKEAGIAWRAIAENLYQQRGCPDAIRCAVEGWLNSPGHRQNLLNPQYTHSGIGISPDSRGAMYYTQIFLVP